MRAILLSLCLLCPALANAQDDANEAVAIGPWQIEASYRGADFQRCVMRRTTEDGIDVSFSRDAGGLELRMASPRWRLKRGDSYPVDLIAGSTSIMTNVNASKNAVSLAIEDERFLKALRLADELDVKGAGSTISVALDKSAAGLERLDTCYTKNTELTETNPFVAPSRKP